MTKLFQNQYLEIDNLPTPKDEAWKYTNLKKGLPANLNPEAVAQEVVLHKTCGENGGQVEDILWIGRDKTHHAPSLKITLEENAILRVVERFEGDGAYWTNMQTEITLAPGAQLTHIRVQGESDQALHTNHLNVSAAEGASYQSFTLTTGARMSRQDVTASLNGAGADIDMRGINLLSGTQHADTTIVMKHVAAGARSNQFFRSVLDDRARGVFQGKVYVDRVAQKTDAYQRCNAILLSNMAEMDAKPELEIYADDVKCSHGATTGQIDENALFYLRARGVPKDRAQAMLIEAFLGEVVEDFGDDAQLRDSIAGWLGVQDD